MIIINADDWGRSRSETDAALSCFLKGRITSATAMVFMADSERAASLAKEAGIDIGLHLNLSQPLSGATGKRLLEKHHERVTRFLTTNKYSMLLFHPRLREAFHYVYWAQVEEFFRLYGKPPSHIDGHHHKHLCSNMLLDHIIPDGEKVRRSFSFQAGEKGALQRGYRRWVDQKLARRHAITDYFFAVSQSIGRPERLRTIAYLAREQSVEVMTHPLHAAECAFLMSEDFRALLSRLRPGTYADLGNS